MDDKLPLPPYVLKMLNKQRCTSCNFGLKHKDVTHVGICRYEDGYRLFYMIVCPKCEQFITVIVATNGEMTFERLTLECSGLNDEEVEDTDSGVGELDLGGMPPENWGPPNSPDEDDFPPIHMFSGISDDEVYQFLRDLEGVNTHDDFMKIIGVTEEEMRRYLREE